MSYIFKKGATSQSIEVYIVDSTNGTPETGVLWNTAGIDLKYRRKDAAVVSITEAALTTPALTDTWETGGFLEIGNGVYRLDLPDAVLASAAGIDRVVVFGTVTGMVVLPVTIHLTDIDLNTALASSTIGTCTTNTDLVTVAAIKTAIEAGGSHLALIKAITDVIPDAGALTTIAADAARLTAVRAAVLTDLIDGGRLDLILDIIAADTTTDIPALIAALNNISTAQVNAQVLDVLNVDTFAEPGQEAPAATTTLVNKIAYLYKFLRNKVTNDGTNIKVYNDAGAVVDQKNTVSEAAGTVTRGKFGTGP